MVHAEKNGNPYRSSPKTRMAVEMRIRSVKPGFWKSETLSSVGPFSRLAAIALLNYADDRGYFICNHLVIRGELFPFEEDSKNVLGAIEDLSRIGFLALGKTAEGKRVGHIVNFLSHQRIDKPQLSEIEGLEVIWEHSKSIPRMIQEPSKGEAEADTEKEGKRNVPRQAAFTPPSEQEWVEYCTRTWSDWHPVCAGESWAYYQGVGWIVGRKICKDWKSTARTAHGNARQWGKLQPQRQAWVPPVPPPITCKPGELDGISKEATDRL